MGLRINQNIAAQNAYRNLSVTDNQMSKSLEKLSSGFRINRAADDAAGLSISEGLRAQVGGLKVAVRNAQDAISVVQTAEGALNEVTSMLQRMRDLAVQANNASLDSDAKNAAQKEFSQLASEIDRIGETTSFGKSKLLDGSFGVNNEAAATGNKVTSPLPTNITFAITSLNGKDLGADAKEVNVNFTASDPDVGVTAQDIADQTNAALETALKAAGGQGNELRMSAKVAPDGSGVTFGLSGTAKFTAGDDATLGVTNNLADFELTAGASTPKTGASNGAFQIGANAGETLNIGITSVNSEDLGLSTLDLRKDASATTSGLTGAADAIKALDTAIKKISDNRAELGAYQNRFEHTINNLNVSVENLSASESRIRDTDMAQEMVAYTRNQILTQAGTSMLSQANQASQNVLSLLR